MQNSTQQMIQVSPDTLTGWLGTLVDINRPGFVWGSPGIGKSDQINGLPRHIETDLDLYEDPDNKFTNTQRKNGVLMLDFRASQWDAVDTRGIPTVTERDGDRVTTWCVPDVFPSAKLAKQHAFVIIFFDELNHANQSVMAALFQLFLDRRLGDYVLPDNVRLFAAGNKESDRAITSKMPTPLADRFFHVELLVDGEAWERWALDVGNIHIAVLSYRRWKPDHLHVFDPKSPSKSQATPRGWEWVSEALSSIEARGVNGEVERALICGKLGEVVGTEFLAFLRIYRDLPDPATVILNADTIDVPTEPSVLYALCGALGDRAERDTMDQLVTFAERLTPEFQVLLMRTVQAKHPECQQTKAYIKWGSNNPGLSNN